MLTFTPPQYWYGSTNFTFYATDEFGAISQSVATITINIEHVNNPPSISIHPSSLIVTRNQYGNFSVKVKDIDSTSITIYLVIPTTLPFDYSTLIAHCSPSNVELIDEPQNNTLLCTLNNTVSLAENELIVSWGPDRHIPEETIGSFTLIAIDSDGAKSTSSVIARVEVAPNHLPVIDPSVYNFTVNEDAWTTVSITLAASDEDEYQSDNLDFIIQTLPANMQLYVPVLNYSVNSADLPFVISRIHVVASISGGSEVEVVVGYPSQNFFGVSSFLFNARDDTVPIPGESLSQEVFINVNHVNHPPTASSLFLTIPEDSCIIHCGTLIPATPFDQVQSFQIQALDVDRDTPLYISFTSIPSNGLVVSRDTNTDTLVVISSTYTSIQSSDSLSWQIWYQPPRYEHSPGCINSTCNTPYVTFGFVVSDGINKSVEYNLTVVVTPVNHPPASQDLIFTMLEGTTLDITLPAVDIDDADTSNLIAVTRGTTSLFKGSFFTSSNVVIPTSENLILSDRRCSYTPSKYDYSDPIGSPYARLYFRIVDSRGAVSKDYTVTIIVNPVPSGIEFYGNSVTNTSEDTAVLIGLGRRGVDWISYDRGEGFVTILYIPQDKGIFKECLSDTCKNITQNNLPYVFSPGALVYFQPERDQFGDNYATILYSITLDVPNETPNYIVLNHTINVSPVNDPPVLIPHWTNPVIFDEDSFGLFEFTATDIDSDTSTLHSYLQSDLKSGIAINLYLCNGASSNPAYDCSNDLQLFKIGAISQKTANARWKLSVVPYKQANGDTGLIFSVADDYEAQSNFVYVKIKVRPINDPPVLTLRSIAGPVLQGSNNPDLDLVGFRVTITDPDFYNLPVKLTVNADHGYFDFDFNATLKTGEVAPCNYTQNHTNSVTCVGLSRKLPSFIALLLFHPEWSSQSIANFTETYARRVIFVVDDLGNVDYRGEAYALTDTKDVILEGSLPALVATPNENSNTSLAIPAAVGVVIALILILIVLACTKRNQKAVDGYFAQFAMNIDSSAQGSPLYKQAAVEGASPVYKGKQ